MRITADDLAVDFFPRVGFSSHADRARAWTQLHEAARALAGLASGWGSEPEDPRLAWSQEDAGWLAHGRGPLGEVIGWLDFGGGSLWLERREPQEGAWIELDGRDVTQLSAWVMTTSERLSGAARSSGGPACDCDPGVAITIEDPDTRVDLEAIYEGAGLLLGRLGESGDSAWGEPVISTARFDATAALRGGEVVVGVAPPDDRQASGSWFVRIGRGARGENFATPDLPHGSWVADAGALCAHLPITALTHLEEGESQHARIAGFLVAALGAFDA